jgi:hypothetical protein
MKITVLITSVIDPQTKINLNSTRIRSFFNNRERLIQTIATVHSVYSCLPDAQVILCDGSSKSYEFFFKKAFPKICYIFSDDFQAKNFLASECFNKSAGECFLLLMARNYFFEDIQNSDFVLKISGRYLISNLNNKDFLNYPDGCYLFSKQKSSDIRSWVDESGFDWSLARHHNCPEIYPRIVLNTIIYGWHSMQTNSHFDRINLIYEQLQQDPYFDYDIENLLSRELFMENIIRTNWDYLGFNGASGEIVRG